MLSTSAVGLTIHITLVVGGTSKICKLFKVFNFLVVYKDICAGMTVPCQQILSFYGIDRNIESSCIVADCVNQVLKVLHAVCKSCKVKVRKMTVLKLCDASVLTCQLRHPVNHNSKSRKERCTPVIHQSELETSCCIHLLFECSSLRCHKSSQW